MKAKLILIGVGASVVLAGLWFMFLWKPAGEDLEKAKADRATAEQASAQLQVKLAHLKKLKENEAVLEADKARFLEAMPDKDKLDEFIHQMSERAARAGVDFKSISPSQPAASSAAVGAPAGATSLVTIPVQLAVTGDYFQVLRFLDELRDGPRIVTVDSFSLAKAGENSMSASIGGRMFMNPSAAPAATTPSA